MKEAAQEQTLIGVNEVMKKIDLLWMMYGMRKRAEAPLQNLPYNVPDMEIMLHHQSIKETLVNTGTPNIKGGVRYMV
ncbi:hypothetical protein SESBI_28415 [Sesbania bispinosa]|nr:hypothetical protein SESBI_28415 [Sesbania bispinosa]